MKSTPLTDSLIREADELIAPLVFFWIFAVLVWLSAVLAWVFWFRGNP
jgi:hypothetical protein